jgi:hypothetical protein
VWQRIEKSTNACVVDRELQRGDPNYDGLEHRGMWSMEYCESAMNGVAVVDVGTNEMGQED